MLNRNIADYFSMIDARLRESFKQKMEINLSEFLKSDLNKESYYVAIQRATLFSKIEDEKYKNDVRDGYRGLITSGGYKRYIEFCKEILDKLDLYQPDPHINTLPKYSFFLRFKFTLRKPFYSHDDEDFYIIDNPVVKEHVLKIPMMRPSSWKGNLRSNMIKINNITEKDCDNPLIKSLFGCADKEGKAHKKGCLIFYPTYFDDIGLEVINPHDRKTRAGTNPILYEVVPKDSRGVFSLLYVPFDLIGKEEKEIKERVAEDIQLISKGLKAMFRDYGFGAKTSSGYGVARPDLKEGIIVLKAGGIRISQKEEPQPPDESFNKYLNEDGSVNEAFRGSGEAGLLSNREYGKKGRQLGGGSRDEFKEFRHWYGVHGEQWQKSFRSESLPASESPNWTFSNFEELIELAKQIKASLNTSEAPQ